jgi:uncharacterized membrane protein
MCEYFLAMVFGVTALLPLVHPTLNPTLIAVSIGVTTVALAGISIFVLVRMGQGGSAGAAEDGSNEPVGDRTLDRYWKAGVIYFNRNDPALVVEKRFGIGYTFNMAHPLAWVVLAVVITVPLLATFLLRR